MKKQHFFRNMIFTVTACICLTGTTALAKIDIFSDHEISRADDGAICVDFGEVQVYLPSDWSGLCQMSPSSDQADFYQIKSRNLYKQKYGEPSGGLLFSINCSEDFNFLELPYYEILGSCNGLNYYLTYPTDVQGYTEDDAAMAEYGQMVSDLDWIAGNIVIQYEDSLIWDDIYTDSEHILPQSSTEYLVLEDIDHLDAAELQMAINELYARHHRKFLLTEVQEYFDSCSWYDGYIEASDFDPSVMNAYEGSNLTLLVERLNRVKADPTLVSDPDAGMASESELTDDSDTEECYGMIIEAKDGSFRVRQSDGSTIQFWYDTADLADMGISQSELSKGATVSLIYTLESYQAIDILIF